VIYVQAAATGSACATADGTLKAPFCDLDKAAQLLASNRNIIVARGPDISGGTLNFTDAPVIVAGQSGAKLTGGGATAAIVTVKAGDVTLRDLTISGATAGIGVYATGGTLRMTRCQVEGNDTGIKTASAAFDITNTIVAGNTGSAGGVTLGTFAGTGPKTFAFNTVTANSGIGVFCATGTNYPLANSIVSGNGATQATGCSFTDACATTCSPATMLTSNYHLQPSSVACIDKVASGFPADDIDGDPRPQGSAADCGADEVKP
jgi:hypothetical protein